MLIVYSLLLTLGFILMSPLFLLRRQKYASGFRERLGNYAPFHHDGRNVIWLHCVSVGETNAARPLVDQLRANFPDHRIVISTTTFTGQTLACSVFKDKADAVIYFPFDWKFSVRRALANYRPSIVLLMETEIWPRFIYEAKKSGAKIAIVNGRLSARSFARYSRFKGFMQDVLANVDTALMQGENDRKRIIELGVPVARSRNTGNLKFDLETGPDEQELSASFRRRFGIGSDRSLIVAASTHSPEEVWLLSAFGRIVDTLKTKPRLLIVPRHPERFNEVAAILERSGRKLVRRTSAESEDDQLAEVILLDSIGELRGVYPLADLVFIGGSLIPHGGQSLLEPAAFGKAFITGPFTHNFEAVVKEFLARKAFIQLPETVDDEEKVALLADTFEKLLADPVRRETLGRNAEAVMEANRGATERTIEYLRSMIAPAD